MPNLPQAVFETRLENEIRHESDRALWRDMVESLGGVLVDSGTVTQDTSITTGVTINKTNGQITTVSTTLGAAEEAAFTVTNSTVTATSVVVACLAATTSAGTPVAVVTRVAAGSFQITVTNLHAEAALNNTLTINFAVFGGAS